MATRQLSKVVHRLHRTIVRQDTERFTDAQLLEWFIKQQDAVAMETLVRRYGPMVWGVCRRVLRNHHDAEDAFQATFLVLVRRADSIVPRAMLRGWLYGVAHKTALKARSNSAKRREREIPVNAVPEPVEQSDLPFEWQTLIDQEIGELPEKYRTVLLLCDVEGKTRKTAARQLGWPEGTVAGRLAAARGLLAKRLARHNIFVATATLFASLGQNASVAAMPEEILRATIESAILVSTGQSPASVVSAHVALLCEGVMKAMLWTKLKGMLIFAMILCAIIVGGGLLAQPSDPMKQQDADREFPQRETKPTTPAQAPPTRNSSMQVTHAVADLVLPIPGLDAEDAKHTKEDWLMRKIKTTVAPKSWDGQGGVGRLQYFPQDRTLVVHNSPPIQSEVRYLLETMRRMQDIQVVVELKTVSIRKGFLPKIQQTIPNLRPNHPLVLSNVEVRKLVTQSQGDRATTILQCPKITLFSGQRSRIVTDKLAYQAMAMVAGNLRHVEFDFDFKSGAVQWAKSMRLADGATLAVPLSAEDDRITLLLVTTTILIASEALGSVQVPLGDKELPSAVVSTNSRPLAEALKNYEKACEENHIEQARRWAMRALEIDPRCFQKSKNRDTNSVK